MNNIHQRPDEADGIRFGDWEMNTILLHQIINYLSSFRLLSPLSNMLI